MRTLLFCLVCLVASSVAAPSKAQQTYPEIVVFGDSTVDTGNLYLATHGAVGAPPYFPGRFSNGPVWVEVLAGRLGLEAPTPSLVGGTNYAWAGAQTGDGLSIFETPNLGLQTDSFLNDRATLAGDELIVVAAGGNDIIWEAPFSPRKIARNIAHQITKLTAAGGRTFLVPSLPVYGQAPLLLGTSDEVRVDTLAAEINHILNQELSDLEQQLNITILRLDVAGLVAEMLVDPEEFGLTNVTAAACPGCNIGVVDPDAADTLVPNPDEYLWWDLVHWTRVVNEVIGEMAVEVVLPE